MKTTIQSNRCKCKTPKPKQIEYMNTTYCETCYEVISYTRTEEKSESLDLELNESPSKQPEQIGNEIEIIRNQIKRLQDKLQSKIKSNERRKQTKMEIPE